MQITHRLEKVRTKRRGPEEAKLRNIVDMALGFSAMMRLFEKSSKEKIQEKILELLPRVFVAQTETDFKRIHSEFCRWGVQNITRTRREKDGEIVKERGPASYGQIGKTLDVVLHVVINYARYPDNETASVLSKWLNAAMDTNMMAFLSGCYPDVMDQWPISIEQVDEIRYNIIQDMVRQFILEEHEGKIMPVQFDDIYWEALNRR